MNKQDNIRQRWVWINRLFIFLVVFVLFMVFLREYQSFNESVDYFNETSFSSKVHEIEHEVDNRIEEIESVEEEYDIVYRNQIKAIVQDVDFFASLVVDELDANATLEEKREAYINTVYEYDLTNDDYLFFAIDLNGISYLSGITKNLEGTDITGLQDSITGDYFVIEMIDIINASPDGDGYITYHWLKELDGEHLKKTSYLYYNEEVDLFIGTGVYEVDYLASVQEELFSRISSYYNGTETYIYIFDYEGNVIFHPMEGFDSEALLAIETTDGESFHEYIVSSLEEEESVEFEYVFDFTGSSQMKYAYVRRVENWDMYLGRSFIIDDLRVQQSAYFNRLIVNYVVFNSILLLFTLALVITLKGLIDKNFKDVQIIFKEQNDLVKELSYTDQLTKLYNRKYFETYIEKIQGTYNNITVTMIDANGLKLINDAYGHIAGDDLLIELASIIKTVFKEGSHFRWGGDEFVTVLTDASEETLDLLIKLFHEKCNAVKIKDFSISASIGFASSEKDDIDVYRLIDTAESMMYSNKVYESLSTKRQIIDNILYTLYNNFSFEESHSENVKENALKIGKKLKLSKEEMSKLRLAALLHDVGKIGIPDNILMSTNPLSEDDFEEVKKHPEKGMRILSAYPELSEYGNYALTHHERFDGKGYPRGLKGEEIPLFARIITIADAYDAMTSNRVYKKALSKEEAINELIQNKGTQFDPKLVDLFVSTIN